MKEILLTIAIPVYNAQDSLSRCLDSIYPQLKENYELLLLNDGSKDKSLQVLREFEARTPGITRVIDKENEGVAVTRNRAIQEARGKYITFLDNDDFVEPDYFEIYLSQVETEEYDFVLAGYRRVDDEKTLFTVPAKHSQWYPFTVTAPWAKLYRTDFLREQGLSFLSYPLGEDIYFSLALYAKKPKTKIIDYIGYNWYFNTASVSNTVQRGFDKRIDIIELSDKLYSVGNLEDELYALYYVRFLVWYLLFSGQSAPGKEFYAEYLKIRKWLKEKQITYYFPLFSGKVYGERFMVRLEIWGFIILSRVGLIKPFIRLFCKG